MLVRGRGHLGESGRFLKSASHFYGDQRAHRANHEWNAPAPRFQLLHIENALQQEQDTECEELAHDERDVLEAGPEAAMFLAGHLAEVGRAGTVFTADAHPLQHAGNDQQCRREHADGRVRRSDCNQQRPEAHKEHGCCERVSSAMAIRITPHEPTADGAHQKADRKDSGGVQQLRGLIGRREERFREVEREGGVDVPVVPLDKIANGAADDGAQTVCCGRRGGRCHDGLGRWVRCDSRRDGDNTSIHESASLAKYSLSESSR